MKKYKSNSNYLIGEILFILLTTILAIIILFSSIENTIILISGVIFGITFFALIVKRQIERLIQIEFNDENIIMKFRFPKKIVQIEYSNIIEFKYFAGSRTPTKNILKYDLNNGSTKKIKFYSIVPNEEYIAFIKWLKEKNEKIEFKIYPPDSKLEYDYQKEFGLKFKKVLKETL